ncbi:glutamyl-tRNA(Gln) amidotransferase subunit B, chloroplastic/mitochondrial [Haematococcus lacustris]|uniref:Glutamyl-tRNA(Gln) amidotransferase subunit B, chloroplastic/mitochondrial n=1 Tax=Haematococcus lacustris TaxID=44745 RepID=A0A6A0A2Q0_HAELA|nr:glutamyl-tRNA(Gln) amidotransferase subunit B, chloroplastic/mitochondrial [Haematococcus lacustris]
MPVPGWRLHPPCPTASEACGALPQQGRACLPGRGAVLPDRCTRCGPALLPCGELPVAYVEGRGMLMITDQAVVAAMVDKVLSASPKQLAEYRAGKVKLMAFFEG